MITNFVRYVMDFLDLVFYDELYIIQGECISELMKGKRFHFDIRIDTDSKVLDPPNTQSDFLHQLCYLLTGLRGVKVRILS